MIARLLQQPLDEFGAAAVGIARTGYGSPPADLPVCPLAAQAARMEDAGMTLPAQVTQRDLVKMAVLLSPERVSATYRRSAKGNS